MQIRVWILVVPLALMCVMSTRAAGQTQTPRDGAVAIERALTFLAREVPKWSAENKCYSCHNNGDAARALFAARRRGFHVEPNALADTSKWLNQPEEWKHNGGEGVYSDKKLAAIQFGSALVDALESGERKGKTPLLRAAQIVAGFQDDDGSWKIDAQGTIGSPVTYGNFLATTSALRVLSAADAKRFRNSIDRGERWLRCAEPKTVLDAAAAILSRGAKNDGATVVQQESLLRLIRDGQCKSGGWGPFVTSRPEAFDTALALLALSQLDDDDEELRDMIARGRDYLIEQQSSDGSWVETTRPAGAESYAQRLSTTGWATLALLATVGRCD